jgi:hypothetical protein
VEDGVGEERVDWLLEDKLLEVRLEHRGPLSERFPGVLDHRGSGVDRHDVAARKPLEQQLGHPPAAAAGVEDGLVPA